MEDKTVLFQKVVFILYMLAYKSAILSLNLELSIIIIKSKIGHHKFTLV